MDRERIHALVELLPPAELVAAERFLSFLVAQAGWAAGSIAHTDRTPAPSTGEGAPGIEGSVSAPTGSWAEAAHPAPAAGVAQPGRGPATHGDVAAASDPTATPRPTTADSPPDPPAAESLASCLPPAATSVERAPAGKGWPSMEPSMEVSA